MKSFLLLTLSVWASCLVAVASFAAVGSITGKHNLLDRHSSLSSLTTLHAAGKGFGSTPQEAKKKNSASTTTTTATSTSDNKTAPAMVSQSSTSSSSSSPPPPPRLNEGQKALAEMRRQRAEQKNAELAKVRDMLQADQQVEDQPAAIPERVAQRMGRRMIPFVGLPLFGGMTCFVTFWYLATYRDLEFQPALVAFSTILILVFSLLGITYSVMSASWDEDREGSFWGVDEFQRNLDNIKDGLGRSKENAILRDRLQSGQVRLEDVEATTTTTTTTTKKAKATTATTLSEKLQQDGLDG